MNLFLFCLDSLGHALALDAAGAATAKGRRERKVNVFLRVEAHNEGGDVDRLLADPVLVGVPNVALADEHAGVVDALGHAELEHQGLQAALEQVLDGEAQHVVELCLVLVEDACADQAADQGVALKQALGVLLVEGEQLTGGAAQVGQREGHAPDLVLVLEAVLAGQLELGVQAVGAKGSSRDLVGL